VEPETSACLDEQTLAEFVSGELDPGTVRRVEAHLVGCTDCRGVVADAAHGANDLALSQTQPPAQAWPKQGELLAEKYRIEEPLGRGGMGLVLGARHIELGHRVAIKILDSKDPLAAARFLREAKTCAQLVNDHIVRVFDLGRLPDGVPYFVMEHLRGRDLGSRIANERLPVSLAVQYLLQVCAALKEAHAMGVIHRDLKPSNLFVVERSDGKPWVKVLDFGISKLVTTRLGHTPQLTLTLPDAVLGSPLYMSPEQLRGSKTLDARSDIWSLGVIAYELLTQRRPFEAQTLASVLVRITTEAPVPPSSLVADLPVGLEAVVLRCLEKDPEARFPNIDAVIDALSPFADPGFSGAAIGKTRRGSPRRWPLAPLVLVCLGGWVFWQRSSAPVAAPSPEASRQSLEPAPRLQLGVRCDRPLPPGDFRWVPASESTTRPWAWPVERLCEAESLADRRAELLTALGDTTLPAHAALEPQHPFYSVVLQQTPERLTIALRHAQSARVTLALRGAPCSAIKGVLVREAAAGGRAPWVAATPAAADPCERSVELPFEAYGRRLSFRIEPSEYSVSDLEFQGERLALGVQANARRPSKAPRIAKTQHGNEAQPGREAQHAGDCLPPAEFCRK
jgi:eukaryotic-like serine/threonine-protein kinase